mmetsp:Transcript_16670/g.65108  ORF Transcript_16670/g.65108 Transcript_16670/m.65108 type:complete len:916 (+) Transcript_16670:31-2778(+)
MRRRAERHELAEDAVAVLLLFLFGVLLFLLLLFLVEPVEPFVRLEEGRLLALFVRVVEPVVEDLLLDHLVLEQCVEETLKQSLRVLMGVAKLLDGKKRPELCLRVGDKLAQQRSEFLHLLLLFLQQRRARHLLAIRQCLLVHRCSQYATDQRTHELLACALIGCDRVLQPTGGFLNPSREVIAEPCRHAEQGVQASETVLLEECLLAGCRRARALAHRSRNVQLRSVVQLLHPLHTQLGGNAREEGSEQLLHKASVHELLVLVDAALHAGEREVLLANQRSHQLANALWCNRHVLRHVLQLLQHTRNAVTDVGHLEVTLGEQVAEKGRDFLGGLVLLGAVGEDVADEVGAQLVGQAQLGQALEQLLAVDQVVVLDEDGLDLVLGQLAGRRRLALGAARCREGAEGVAAELLALATRRLGRGHTVGARDARRSDASQRVGRLERGGVLQAAELGRRRGGPRALHRLPAVARAAELSSLTAAAAVAVAVIAQDCLAVVAVVTVVAVVAVTAAAAEAVVAVAVVAVVARAAAAAHAALVVLAHLRLLERLGLLVHLLDRHRLLLLHAGHPALPAEVHEVLDQEADAALQIGVVRQHRKPRKVLVQPRLLLRVRHVQELAHRREELAQRLDVRRRRVLLQHVRADVHDLRRKHLRLEQLSDELHVALHALAEHEVLLGALLLGEVSPLCLDGLGVALELLLATVEQEALEVLASPVRVAVGQHDAEVGVHLAVLVLEDGLLEDEVDHVRQLVLGNAGVEQLVADAVKILDRELVQQAHAELHHLVLLVRRLLDRPAHQRLAALAHLNAAHRRRGACARGSRASAVAPVDARRVGGRRLRRRTAARGGAGVAAGRALPGGLLLARSRGGAVVAEQLQDVLSGRHALGRLQAELAEAQEELATVDAVALAGRSAVQLDVPV